MKNQQGYKIRTGKLIAQGAHASMKAVLNTGDVTDHKTGSDFCIPLDTNEALFDWLEGRFTKVCVGVNSEQELLDVYNAAVIAGIECRALIEDAGLTEFGGVKTFTCAAIGPDYPDRIDPITKSLKLF